MSGTDPTSTSAPSGSVTPPSITPGSVSTDIANEVGTLIAEGEAEVGTLEGDAAAAIEPWVGHPGGPFAGIVAWVQSEIAKVRADLGATASPAAPAPATTKP
jgi:hypothetical protein